MELLVWEVCCLLIPMSCWLFPRNIKSNVPKKFKFMSFQRVKLESSASENSKDCENLEWRWNENQTLVFHRFYSFVSVSILSLEKKCLWRQVWRSCQSALQTRRPTAPHSIPPCRGTRTLLLRCGATVGITHRQERKKQIIKTVIIKTVQTLSIRITFYPIQRLGCNPISLN